MRSATVEEIFSLPAKERVRLAKELLESVVPDAEPPLTQEEKAILDEAIAEDEAHPGEGMTWEELSKRLRPKARRNRVLCQRP